jgi:hypothetical protein
MRLRSIGLCLTATVTPVMLSAQSAQVKLTAAQEIAAAVAAAPAELRDGATVLGLRGFTTVELRKGTNDMVCLGPRDDPKQQFQVACYHKGLEPFMARGRALRAEGVKDPERDSVRFKEITSGKLKMPSTPSALYTLNGGAFDPATGKVNGAKWLYVVYIPGATMASTGISEKPAAGVPWIMFPGTPKAHIMFTPGM